jgi:hypothetical protein
VRDEVSAGYVFSSSSTLHVADASGNYSSESISKTKFKVIGSKTDFRRSGTMWLYE